MAKLNLAAEHRPSLEQVGEMVTVLCSCGFDKTVKAPLAAETWDGHVWMTVRIRRPHARSLMAVAGDRPNLSVVPDMNHRGPSASAFFDDLADTDEQDDIGHLGWAAGADHG